MIKWFLNISERDLANFHVNVVTLLVTRDSETRFASVMKCPNVLCLYITLERSTRPITTWKRVYDNYVLKIEKITGFVVDFLWAAVTTQWSIHLHITPYPPHTQLRTVNSGQARIYPLKMPMSPLVSFSSHRISEIWGNSRSRAEYCRILVKTGESNNNQGGINTVWT